MECVAFIKERRVFVADTSFLYALKEGRNRKEQEPPATTHASYAVTQRRLNSLRLGLGEPVGLLGFLGVAYRVDSSVSGHW